MCSSHCPVSCFLLYALPYNYQALAPKMLVIMFQSYNIPLQIAGGLNSPPPKARSIKAKAGDEAALLVLYLLVF